mgnify:CR=1 FL=1
MEKKSTSVENVTISGLRPSSRPIWAQEISRFECGKFAVQPRSNDRPPFLRISPKSGGETVLIPAFVLGGAITLKRDAIPEDGIITLPTDYLDGLYLSSRKEEGKEFATARWELA